MQKKQLWSSVDLDKQFNKHIDYKFVSRSFSNPETVFLYEEAARKVGLWPSELLLIQKYLSSLDRILDIGCGAGRTTVGLYNSGFRNLVGIDLSDAMIKAAQAVATGMPILFAVANACCLPFAAETFDAALFSCNGLMHIPGRSNRKAAVGEIRRVLKLNGHFICVTTCREATHPFWIRQRYLWKQRRYDKRLYEFGDVILDNNEVRNGYLHHPTPSEVKALIQDGGLVLVQHDSGATISSKTSAFDKLGANSVFWVAMRSG